MEAFSDGVFAIAITLLILDLHVPDSPDRLIGQLAAEWPSFLGYLVSFAFIGGSWIAHSGLTRLLRVTDGMFLSLNLLQLLFVSFLPFSTSLFTKHLTGSGERFAVVIFGLNLTLGVLVSSVMISYVARMDELKSDVDPGRVAWIERERWMTVALFALSTGLSFLVPKVAVGFYLLLSLMLIGQPVWQLYRRAWAHWRRAAKSGDGPAA
jgi:uncharacterized membrane protein